MPSSRHRNVERKRKSAASRAIKVSPTYRNEDSLSGGGGGVSGASVKSGATSESGGPNWMILGVVGLIAVVLVGLYMTSGPKPAPAAAPTAATTPPAQPATPPKNEIVSLPANKEPEPTTPTPAVKELKIEDVAVGKGAAAKTGQEVTVHYTGTLLNGTKFDSSRDGGKPYTFTLGAGTVIKGWDQGIVGMKAGGKRKLTIPADLAYGSSGRPPVIPPDSPLLFDVELVSVKDAAKPAAADKDAKKK
ncbi:MAG TPA: FKBP-type peptidyl-prolyl cis-trans isomerase [Acidobacteriota bacterium]|nr:FKBP-type peptidyl-prolyl cis-trans isomerase [Acidobacteriota bacterium]HNB69590.1 FKBP-type peptidyl-prolyl cis-trans isomerase [Acidobacteriota bacterium]HNG91342.1 FKBP-type peptidyl-prolyl cis-trans isomerase [Acidobacteriota bacterium]HNH84244.1 FKBP-type peptidyl-prolyl cis-trans isomerase [Acidobacteriota bacterium]